MLQGIGIQVAGELRLVFFGEPLVQIMCGGSLSVPLAGIQKLNRLAAAQHQGSWLAAEGTYLLHSDVETGNEVVEGGCVQDHTT